MDYSDKTKTMKKLRITTRKHSKKKGMYQVALGGIPYFNGKAFTKKEANEFAEKKRDIFNSSRVKK